MNRRVFTSCIVVSLLIFSALLCLRSWLTDRPVSAISCSGHLSLYKGESALHLLAKLRFKDDRGSIHLSGTLHQDSTGSAVINRTIEFILERINNIQIWTSISVTPAEEEKEAGVLSGNWLSPFYLYPNNAIRVSVERINLNSILISDEFAPYFVCSEQ